jgi:hypothetical protein
MRAPGVLLFLILFSTSAFPGDGLLKQQIGGSVRAAVSSHGQTFIAQGSTLVTLSWNSNRIPTVSEISRPFDGWLKHLHVDGDTLWAAAASEHERGHIYEFSLSEDRAPRFEKEWLSTDGTMPNFGVLASVGDLIYVGGYNGLITGYQTTTSGLQQVFQLEPDTPTLNSRPWVFRGFEYWEDGLLMAVIQMGSRHRAVGGYLVMHMLDVSVPEAPYVISQITGFGDRGYARQGRMIAALTTAGFTFYDWSDPHDPRLDTTHLVAHSSLLGGFFKDDH